MSFKSAGIVLALVVLAGLSRPPVADAAPAGRFSVRLELEGVPAGVFAGIQGGGAEVEVIEEKIGDDPIVRKRPGKVKYANITLKRGQVIDATLRTWFAEAMSGTTARKSGSIVYLDREGNEVLRLSLTGCWPAAFEAGPFEEGVQIVESFEIGMESMERGSAPASRSRFAPARTFRIEIDGVTAGGVVSSSPVRVEHAPSTDGGAPAVNTRNFTLACATGFDEVPHEWFREVAKGKDIRKSISIVLTASRGTPSRTYTYHECWPCRWKAPELNSNSDTFIVEELEFAVERVERG